MKKAEKIYRICFLMIISMLVFTSCSSIVPAANGDSTEKSYKLSTDGYYLEGFDIVSASKTEGFDTYTEQIIVADKETHVEYIILLNGRKMVMTVLYDSEGKPKIYKK